MSLEELFVKEYQELSERVRELEKQNKLLELENKSYVDLIREVGNLIEEAKPNILESNALYFNSVYVDENHKQKVLSLLSKIGIQIIKKEPANE